MPGGDDVSWNTTLVWFGVGMPLCALVLVALDRLSTPSARRAFVPSVAVRERRHRIGTRSARVRPDTAAASPASATLDDPPSPFGVGDPPAPTAGVPTAPARSRRLVAVLEASTRPPRPVQRPWAPGDSVHHPLVTGAAPSPATVRKRAWSAYATIASAEVYGPGNVERLERGRPPQRYNPLVGGVELMHIEVDDVGHARMAWPGSDTACDPFAVAS